MNLKRINRRLSATIRRAYRTLYKDPAALALVGESERLGAQLRYRQQQHFARLDRRDNGGLVLDANGRPVAVVV